MASATKDTLTLATVAAAALAVADGVLVTGNKSPAKKLVKKSGDAGAAAGAGAGAGAGAAGAIKKAGAAAGAGAADATKEAGGTSGAAANANTKLRLTEAVRPEALERARDMCFSSNQPLPLDCPQTKPTRQQLWDMLVVFCTFNSQGMPLPQASEEGSGSAGSAAEAKEALSDDAATAASAVAAEEAASTEAGKVLPGSPPSSSATAGGGGQGDASGAANAAAAAVAADNSLSAAHPSATEANGGSTAATANTDVDSSADRTVSDWQTARSKKKICRGFRAGWGCSRPDTCKLFHPTVCNGPCRRAGGKQVEGCTGWHLWTQWGLAKPRAKGKAKPNASGSPAQSKIAQGNLNTGSSKAKTAPKLQPANTNSTTSMSKRMREMEIELATMRGAQNERRSSQGRQLPPMPLSSPPGSQLPPQAQQLPWAEPAPSDPAQRSMFSVLQEILSRLDVLEAGPRRH